LGESQYSYEQLLTQTTALAGHLTQELNLQPGDRVGLWLKNCPAFIPSLFGVLAAQGIVVPINSFLKPDEVSYILDDAGIDLLITDRSFGEAVSKLTAARPALEAFFAEALATLASPAQRQQLLPQKASDLAFIVYTSGTTGRPKGAMLTHGNLLCNVESCRQVLAAVDHDRFVVLLPMFHSFMLCVGLLLPLSVGGSIVLIKSLHPPKNILQEIIHRQATILPAIPQFFRTLLDLQIPTNLLLCLASAGRPCRRKF
jgi:long-chain acyl-CoA synthetase